MDIFIERIVNSPIASNSYIVYTTKSNSCIIIDPGASDSHDLINFLNVNELIPEYIFLTHEHFDHIWGVKKLKELFNITLICSENCATKITNRKKNMSIFYDQEGFEVNSPDNTIERLNFHLLWNELTIKFINTPGHTEASLCIQIGHYLFTGDTLIKDSKTVTKLPGGNKDKLFHSIQNLNHLFKDENVIVYPGHGDSFPFNEINPEFVI